MATSRARISTHRERRSPVHHPGQSLALASLIACLVIGSCRLLTHALSFDAAELDGIAFLASLYWVLSVIGYFVQRPSQGRPSSATHARQAQVAERRTARETQAHAELVA